VKTEIAHARQKEINEQRQVLFPISLVSFSRIRHWKLPDADTGTDSAREIRELFIPDFSNWKHQDQYQCQALLYSKGPANLLDKNSYASPCLRLLSIPSNAFYSIRCQGVRDNLGADLGRSRENPNGTSKRSTAEASANASV